MRPRRTVYSDGVLQLPGGNEDHDLWYQHGATLDGIHVFLTVWEFSPEEREQIAQGQNIQMSLFGNGHPPVALELTDVKLGR